MTLPFQVEKNRVIKYRKMELLFRTKRKKNFKSRLNLVEKINIKLHPIQPWMYCFWKSFWKPTLYTYNLIQKTNNKFVSEGSERKERETQVNPSVVRRKERKEEKRREKEREELKENLKKK